MPAGGGTTKGRARVLARTPYHAPTPAPAHYQGPPPTSYHAAQQAQARAVPKPQRILRRATTGQRVAPQNNAGTVARRLLALQLLNSAPPPSPDRTTGRELAGFASSAFTGQGPFGDAANGFFPDAQGAKVMGYGMQAGNPAQQRIANIDATGPGGRRENVLKTLGQNVANAVGRVVAAGPIGAGVGNVVAHQTWNKLAPLFQRSSGDMPNVSFKTTPAGIGGFTFTGAAGRRAGVTVSTDELSNLFSTHPAARQMALGDLKGTLTHEFAHTQQPTGQFGPKVEGGADAFKNSVAGLVGYKPGSSPKYGAWQTQYFGKPTNLRAALISQFPRVNQRMTPAVAQRVNLAR